MKRGLVLFLVLAMMLSVLSAGGSGERGGNDGLTEGFTFDGTSPLETPEPIKLTYWVPLNGSVSRIISNYDENIAFQEWQKRMGVDIEFIHPAVGQEQEAFNLLMASGELPDIIAAPNMYSGGVFQGLHDGVFADLTDLLPVYAPDYWKVIQEHDDFRREITDDNGRIPLFASYKVPGDPPFRRMVMKQENLDLIGETVPKTVEDYERIFQKFLDAGIVPYMLDGTGIEEEFVNLFDVHADENQGGDFLYRDLDGKIHYAPYEEGYRQYLELINSWYEKGYISKDFASTNANQKKVLFDTDKVGMMVDAVVGTYNRVELEGDTVVSAPAPRLYEGQKLHYERNDATPMMQQNDTMVVISSACEHKDIALAILNYFYTEEGAELLNWGVEGVNWDWVDGERVYNDTMLNNPDMDTETASYYYKAHFAPKLNYPDTQVHANLLKSEGALNIRMQWADDPDVDSLYRLPNIQYTTEELDEATDIQVDLDSYCKEMTLKYITGAESFDNYDEFLKTQEAFGVNRLIEITQTAYDRYMAK